MAKRGVVSNVQLGSSRLIDSRRPAHTALSLRARSSSFRSRFSPTTATPGATWLQGRVAQRWAIPRKYLGPPVPWLTLFRAHARAARCGRPEGEAAVRVIDVWPAMDEIRPSPGPVRVYIATSGVRCGHSCAIMARHTGRAGRRRHPISRQQADRVEPYSVTPDLSSFDGANGKAGCRAISAVSAAAQFRSTPGSPCERPPIWRWLHRAMATAPWGLSSLFASDSGAYK